MRTKYGGNWRRRIQSIRLFAAVAALGCGNDSFQSTQPARPVPESPDPNAVTISGVVYEYTATGRHPAAGVGLSVFSEIGDFAVSDANGRYSASARGGFVAIAVAQPSAYMSPCPTGTTYPISNSNRTFDAAIVSTAVLSTTGMPDSYPRSALALPGTVVEETSAGPRPVAGALVTLGDDRFPGNYSTTLSDTLGRFLLCTGTPGRGTDQSMPLRVEKVGYSPSIQEVFAGYDPVSVQLVRKP